MQLRSPATTFLENLEKPGYLDGHLTLDYGFFPTTPPLIEFPAPYQAWNDAIERIPQKIKTPGFRRFVQNIPQLPIETLPDAYLPLAATFFAVISHAYWNCRATPEKPELPDNIKKSWQAISKRLSRSSLNMDVVDLFINNWRLIDPTLPEDKKFQVENMNIIVPTFANQAEKIFYLTFVEMTYRSRHLVRAVAEANDAVVNYDDQGVKNALLQLLKIVDELAVGLLKANINPNSATYLDPLMLTKTTSFFGTPANGATSTVSGAFSPIFLLLDIALGRTHFDSEIGRQIQGSFQYIPKIYQDFLAAVRKTSIKDYVEQSQDQELQSLYAQTLMRYSGKGGLLSLHRDKAAYGILNVGTRIGRIETVASLVTKQKKPWTILSDELDKSRRERPAPSAITAMHKGQTQNQTGTMVGVTLKAESHVYFTAGDHIQILPVNNDHEIKEILQLLTSSANDELSETQAWTDFFVRNRREKSAQGFTLELLLQYGNITSLTIADIQKILPEVELPPGIKSNMKIKLAAFIRHIESTQAAKLAQVKLKLTQLVVPLTARSYSISSPSSHQFASALCPFAVDLAVTKTAYTHVDATPGQGVTSRFLTEEQAGAFPVVPAQVHPAHRFRMPEEKSKPLVLIAMGSGIAPLAAFYRQNAQAKEGRDIHLFYGVKTQADILAPKELSAIARISSFHYTVATSAEGEQKRITQVIAEHEVQFMLDMMAREACFYVCGSSDFVADVQNVMIKMIADKKFANDPDASEKARKYFYQQVAPNQFFTQEFDAQNRKIQYPPMTLTQVCTHNNMQQGYWMIMGKSVYDLTDYMQVHPGGQALIQLNAGIDGTEEFNGVHAHVETANASHLAQRFKVGELFQPVFHDPVKEEAYDKLYAFLTAITAYQNLMAIDYFITVQADYYWLLKALEAHERFANFIKSTIIPGLINMKAILNELDNFPIHQFIVKIRNCLTQATFPYQKDKYGDVVYTQDNGETITRNVYTFFQRVSKADKELLASLKTSIIASVDKLTDTSDNKAPRSKL